MFKYSLILAGGRGGRMSPLTDNIPKPLVQFNGEPLVNQVLIQLKESILNIYATVGFKKEILSSYFMQQGISGVFNTENKENIWWLYNTILSYLDEPILVSTCDIIGRIDFKEIYHSYNNCGEPSCMLVCGEPISGFDGDFILDEAYKVKIISKYIDGSKVCTGVQVLNPSKIRALLPEANSFENLWQALINKNSLFCSSYKLKDWFTVNTVEHLNIASAQLIK